MNARYFRNKNTQSVTEEGYLSWMSPNADTSEFEAVVLNDAGEWVPVSDEE